MLSTVDNTTRSNAMLSMEENTTQSIGINNIIDSATQNIVSITLMAIKVGLISGVASRSSQVAPGGRAAPPKDQNEEENEENLRKT